MARGINKVILIERYEAGESIREIHQATGVPLSTIRHALNKAGVLRTRAQGIKIAAAKGRLGSGHRGKTRNFTEEHKRNIALARLGSGKGFSMKACGYIEITVGRDKGRGEHVVKMEHHLGRRLRPGECVHHRNHDRSDNHIENLEVLTLSEHSRLHAIENYPLRDRDNKGRFV